MCRHINLHQADNKPAKINLMPVKMLTDILKPQINIINLI